MLVVFDRLLATPYQHSAAQMRAAEATRNYGNAARAYLERKLSDPRRRRTRRELRLAIAMIA